MTAKGIYRTATPGSGAEYAFVDYEVPHSLGEIPRSQYENQGYLPSFGTLPTKEDYFKPKKYMISLISEYGTSEEKTHISNEIIANTNDDAIQQAMQLRAAPGLPDGEYVAIVVRDGMGVGSRKINVKH